MADVISLVQKPLPCPFCGCAEPQFDVDLPGVMCDGCGATGPTVGESHVPDDAADDKAVEAAGIGLWNQRVRDGQS